MKKAISFCVPCGRVAGARIACHWSFLLPLLLLIVFIALCYRHAGLLRYVLEEPLPQEEYENLEDWLSVFLRGAVSDFIILCVLFYAIVAMPLFLHEMAHLLAARAWNVGVRSMKFFFLFGYIAPVPEDMLTLPPSRELCIVAAGPMVNLGIYFLAWGFQDMSRIDYFGILADVNLYLLLFNMIPVIPMDGSRILECLLSLCGISKQKASIASVVISMLSAASLLGYAIVDKDLILSAWMAGLLLLSATLWTMREEWAKGGLWSLSQSRAQTETTASAPAPHC